MKKTKVSVYHTVSKFNKDKSFLYTLRNRNKWFFLVGDIEECGKNVGNMGYCDYIKKRNKEKRDSCVIMVN